MADELNRQDILEIIYWALALDVIREGWTSENRYRTRI